jgi:hypothetical protein
MKYSHLIVAVAVGLGLVLALLWMLPGPSHAALAQGSLAPVPPSLSRQHEPVVISGSLLSSLTGCPLDEIFVYAYQGTTPVQIPFQIDERDAEGMYVPVEDGQLDDNDELIFMAMDGGAWVDHPSLGVGDVIITPTYVITMTDPITDTHGWAYVFRSTALTRTFNSDYVSYDDVNDRITSPGRYALGFNALHGFMDYVTLGGDGTNLLDRSKLRITATLGAFTFFVDEENLTEDDIRVIDGPVRVTRVSTLSLSVGGEAVEGPAVYFAYQSLVVQPAAFVGPGAPFTTDYQRSSMDWNQQVVGMVLYDANNSAGVTIDGTPDVFTATPATRWIQVTGITGTVISVNRIPAGLGGTQSTYYRDDSAIDSGDTGDQRSYGDAGFQVEDPNSDAPPIEGQTYFLTGTTSNVGATYLAKYDNPLQVSVGSVAVAPGKWFTVTAAKDTASVSLGETAHYILSVATVEGFSAPVTLTLQGAPSGTVFSFAPDLVTAPGMSHLYITTTASTLTGAYAMTVTGTFGQLTDTTSLTLTVNPTLTLAAEPIVRTIVPGEAATYTLSVAMSQGFTDPVHLTLQGTPSGATYSFSPDPVTPPGTSQLCITTTIPTLHGTYVVTVSGTTGQVSATTSLTLTVKPVLTLTVQPDVRATLPGETVTYTVSVDAAEGFADPVTLSLQGSPSGAAAAFDPNPVVPSGASQLSITTMIPTVPGTHVMTITGTSDQVTATTSVTLTVRPVLTLTVQPDVRSVLPGETAAYTLSLDAAEGFAAPVTLSLRSAPPGTSVSFDPNPVDPPGASRLSITTTASAADGTYVMTATGTSGTFTDTVDLALIVTSAAHPTFTMSVSPTARIAIPNQAVSYTVYVSGLNGFSEPVSLTVVGLPVDIGTAWSVNPVVPDGLSILTLFVPSHPPFGDHHLQVVGTADAQVVARDIRLTITYLKIYMPVIMRWTH